jgi:hypothetical protein
MEKMPATLATRNVTLPDYPIAIKPQGAAHHAPAAACRNKGLSVFSGG